MSIATALIAEDEPLLARHLVSQLAQLWPALRLLAVVDNGLDAAAQALALRPQVCFLDIRMPGQSGLEAVWAGDVALPASEAAVSGKRNSAQVPTCPSGAASRLKLARSP